MARDVEAEHLLLEGEALVGAPLREREVVALRLVGRSGATQDIEHRHLTLVALSLMPLTSLECAIEGGHELGPGPPARVKGAGLDQALHDAAVDELEVEPPAEVDQRPEDPLLLA